MKGIFTPVILTGFLVWSLFPGMPARAYYVRPIVFPVDGQNRFQDDFADPRAGGTREHLGIDIIAAKMTPVVAAADGHISYLVSPQASWGYALYLRDADGYDYRYLHLNNDTPGTDDGNGGETNAYAPGIARGATVKKGQLLGWVGDSGNAEGTAAHLHFEMHDPERAALNPYESLLAATPPGMITAQGTLKTMIIIPSQYSLIRSADSPTVYMLSGSTKYAIVNEATFVALGFSWSQIKIVFDVEQYRSGLPIQIGPDVIIKREDGTTVSAPASSSRYIFTQTLSLGMRNEEVRQLQIKLRALGYFTYPTNTGYFGSATLDSVLRFQRAKGIEQVGIVGPKTRALLNVL